MMDILKSLTEHELAIALILIGLAREARLWHKQILAYKLKRAKLEKE